MDEVNVLKSVSDTILQESFHFEVDVIPENKLQELLQKLRIKPKKRKFTIKPLTAGSCFRVSRIMIGLRLDGKTIDLQTGVEAMSKYSEDIAEAIAIAVKNRKARPSKKLIDFFLYNLSNKELSVIAKMVFSSLNVEDFLLTIILLNRANILEKKTASAQNAENSEVRPIVPGNLSAV